MITITISRDGRFWYGRKRYKVTIDGYIGKLESGRIGLDESKSLIQDVMIGAITSGQRINIVNNTDLHS